LEVEKPKSISIKVLVREKKIRNRKKKEPQKLFSSFIARAAVAQLHNLLKVPSLDPRRGEVSFPNILKSRISTFEKPNSLTMAAQSFSTKFEPKFFKKFKI
jgi:hypothetical protein